MQSLWIVVSSFIFSLMALTIKLASSDFGFFELTFYSCICGAIGIFLITVQRGLTVRTRHLKRHLMRSVAGGLSMITWFISVPLLPLALSSTLSNTTPLMMAAFVTTYCLFHNRPIPWPLIGTICLGFVGVLSIVQPDFGDAQLWGAVAAITSSVFAAIAYWNVKNLSLLGEPTWRIVFYFLSVSSLLGLTGCLVFEGGFSPITMDNFYYLIAVALTAIFGQLALTRAYGKGNVLLSACLQFSGILFAVSYDLLFFGLTPNLLACAGIAAIIAAGASATVITKKLDTH